MGKSQRVHPYITPLMGLLEAHSFSFPLPVLKNGVFAVILVLAAVTRLKPVTSH